MEDPPRDPYGRFFWELNRLRLWAGQPSSRELARLARKAGREGSHTTFAKAFQGHRLPRWEVVATLILVLQGDLEAFRRLWTAAKAQIAAEPTAADPTRISKLDSARERAAPTERDGRHDPPRGEKASTDTGEREPVKAVVRTSSWALDYDPATASQVILLMVAAVRDDIDPTSLLLDIALHDPVGTAPAIALVADNDLSRAARVVAELATRHERNAARLLSATAQTRPARAADLIRILRDDYHFGAHTLLAPALYACHADRRNIEIAAYFIGVIYREGGREGLVTYLTSLMDASSRAGHDEAGDRIFNAVCAVLEFLLATPQYSLLGVNLLAWFAKHDYLLATQIFAGVIMSKNGEVRRSFDGGTLLGVLAKGYPKGCSIFFLRCLLVLKITPYEISPAIHDLALEDLRVATELIAKMAASAPRPIMTLLAAMEDVNTTAEIVLGTYQVDRPATAQLIAEWMKSTYPDVSTPVGMLVQTMLHIDPQRAMACLATAVSHVPAYPGISLLAGISDPQLHRSTRDLLRQHAGQRWGLIRPYL